MAETLGVLENFDMAALGPTDIDLEGGKLGGVPVVAALVLSVGAITSATPSKTPRYSSAVLFAGWTIAVVSVAWIFRWSARPDGTFVGVLGASTLAAARRSTAQDSSA